jgi:hypothetical protein
VAYIELAALWFELRTFSPDLVSASFPSLGKQDDVDAVLSDGISVAELLERSRPRGADLEPGAVASTSGVRTLPRWRRIASKVARLSTRDTDAANALARGNVVRALLVHLADTRARGRNTGIELARSTLDALAATPVPCLFSVCESDPPEFQLQAARVVQARVAQRGVWPPYLYLLGHNHVSGIMQLGSGVDTLGPQLAQFIAVGPGLPA